MSSVKQFIYQTSPPLLLNGGLLLLAFVFLKSAADKSDPWSGVIALLLVLLVGCVVNIIGFIWAVARKEYWSAFLYLLVAVFALAYFIEIRIPGKIGG